MALATFTTEIGGVSSDLSTAILYDITTYTSPARNALALYCYLFKRDASNNDTAITLDNSTPLTVTQWSFSLPQQDGVFVNTLFGFPLWSAGVYVQNSCVFYVPNSTYYKCAVASTSGTPSISPDWVAITNILSEVLNLSNSGVSITQNYNFSVVRAATGPLGDALASFGLANKNGKCKDMNQASSVMIGGALISSAWTNFRAMNYVGSQEIMDYLDAQTASTL